MFFLTLGTFGWFRLIFLRRWVHRNNLWLFKCKSFKFLVICRIFFLHLKHTSCWFRFTLAASIWRSINFPLLSDVSRPYKFIIWFSRRTLLLHASKRWIPSRIFQFTFFHPTVGIIKSWTIRVLILVTVLMESSCLYN